MNYDLRLTIWLKRASFALLLSTLNSQLSTLHAQGSLAPPGAPAPAMKSLAQIEPRTPISSVPYTISMPGSYYVTTNLTVGSGDALTISASGVTLDLGGWTITSTAASAKGYGIQLSSGLHDLAIFNGHIASGVTNNGSGLYDGSGFAYGISYGGIAPVNTRVTGVSVLGCLVYGINLGYGNSTVVESCLARTVGGSGINASTIKGSVAVDCGLYAIEGDQVSDCRGEISGNGSGVFATTADNCYGSCTIAGTTGVYARNAFNCSGVCGSSGYGVLATGDANNCYGSSVNGGDGVYAGANALNCYGSSTGSGNGVYTTCATGCYGNTTGSGDGVHATASATSCYGGTGSGNGVYAAYLAQSCYGISTGAGSGINVDTILSPGHGSYGTALNCVGTSAGAGTGLRAVAANNCTGTSGSGTGLSASTATGCVGVSSGSGSIGLQAFSIAIGCIGNATSGGTGLTASIANSCVGTSFSVTSKYNMP